MVEVAGDIGVLCQVDDLHAAVHVVVELVVAQSCHIIACRIHQLDNGFALVHGAVGSALNMVAGINQQNILVLLLQLCLHRGDHIVAQNTVDVGMYVVGVENCDVTLGCLCFGGCFHHGFRCGHGGFRGCAAGGKQTQNHHASQQHCKIFAHNNSSSIMFHPVRTRGTHSYCNASGAKMEYPTFIFSGAIAWIRPCIFPGRWYNDRRLSKGDNRT